MHSKFHLAAPIAGPAPGRSQRLGSELTFAISAATGFAIALNAHPDLLPSTWLAVTLASLIILHVVFDPRLILTREATLYAVYLGYLLVSMLWTGDRQLALNTLLPAANFVVVMVLVGSLATLNDMRIALAGTLSGIAAGAAAYTLWSGFPFRYPADFSYNAVAGMYLLGLILTLMLAAVGRSRRLLLLLVAALFMAHIVATTSIKTNLGIVAGVLVVAAFHFRPFFRGLTRNVVVLLALAGCAVWLAVSDVGIRDSVGRGVDRVSLGVEILANREGMRGYSAFDERTEWARAGIRGWMQNPVFGHGVEAFRERFGITSHSTVVDILYNTGLVGFILFYSIFASLLWRLRRARLHAAYEVRAVVLGGIACYLFIMLSGTMHYSAFLAAFFAFSIALLGTDGAPEKNS